MSTHLSRYFEQQRSSHGIKPSELARQCGCTNIPKNGSRIRVFELSGSVSKELFEKLVAFFKIEDEIIERLVEQDRREFFQKWLAWVNEPITPYLVVRIIAAVYSRQKLAPGIATIEEAEAWAASVASDAKKKCCLVWSRKLSIWLDENGSVTGRTKAVPGAVNTPWMRIGGKLFVLGDDLHSVRPVDWLKKPEATQ